jgi:DNA-binding XRE family transcriptional regulator
VITPRTPLPEASSADFGTLLRALRRRARLTQRELGIAVGYSEAQISRLERGERLPDPSVVAALFLPSLRLAAEPDLGARLHSLAKAARASGRGQSRPAARGPGVVAAAAGPEVPGTAARPEDHSIPLGHALGGQAVTPQNGHPRDET